jgi:predicted HTH domain antitoxin
VLGPEHPDTLSSLGGPAGIYMHEGKRAQAAALDREPSTSACGCWVPSIPTLAARYGEAVALHEPAFEIAGFASEAFRYTCYMQLCLDLPDELSAALASAGQDLTRAAFEAIALEAYREHKLSTAQLRRMLGYQTRMEVDGFLKEHGVELDYTLEDLERDREAHRRLGL